MFTVKWIASNGAEHVWPARDVSYNPPLPQLTESVEARPATVSFENPDGGVHCSIDNGRVFVMNDAGRTVADYILKTEEFPHGLMPRAA